MPYSKFSKHEYDENQWVVSLINTQPGITNSCGGHVRIVIEGLKKRDSHLFATELFVGEYHIMEAESPLNAGFIPQAFRNTKCKYIIAITERNNYSAGKEQQYSQASARSMGGITPEEAMKIIQAIKKEHADIENKEIESNYQYAGRWCYYSHNNGDNCVSWAEEKLNIIGIGKHLSTDSIKAVPSLHVDSLDERSSCRIL